MKIILSLLKAFLNFIYFFMKLKKTNKNKITFLSRQQNDISLDMKLIKEELLKNNKNLEMVFLCKRFDNIKKHFISYGFYNLKIMHHISTSHVVITDSYSLPVSVLHHKKDLKVMQIWHALGAIKKFGNDIKREYPIRNYNYVLSTSTYWKNSNAAFVFPSGVSKGYFSPSLSKR